MKKEYMKPEVNEITVEANQAIAGCSITGGFRVEPMGYAYEGQACSENSQFWGSVEDVVPNYMSWFGGMSEEDAKATIRSKTYMNYKVLDESNNLIFFWEDKNRNGHWDGNSSGDNWQDVRNWDLANAVFNS